MSHPNHLSVDYPVAGDTWLDINSQVLLTITHVSDTGVIYYMDRINKGCIEKRKATLDAYRQLLNRYGLTIPTTATDKYIKAYGPT